MKKWIWWVVDHPHFDVVMTLVTFSIALSIALYETWANT